ncbi:hypothetical protein LZF95_07750 [Algoriphagus sp. AGSA1]|uniref:hypothetical protein n=1 Tax=Algoriphagus sp. AGSA1 TaxID=2907213 RepID=UPI001F1B9C3E|nr:hypothetical protein [Algoriphagus sp. AGSA1]MCE7054563.1 hypothetical protein [Algoriphagus sp. AGSA1]
MTDKSVDNKQWTDPKDYGLPYVELVPLTQIRQPKREEEIATAIDVAEVKKRTMQTITPSLAQAETISRQEHKIEEKKSDNSWIWIAALLALGVMLVIIWQMNKTVVSEQDSTVLASKSVEGVAKQENDEVAVNVSAGEESEIYDNQAVVSDSVSSPTPAAESVQTGTTIAPKVSGNLVRVTEKGDRPQFYIIVGSLPNEALALKEAEQYKNRAETVYLIMPYEDVTNYRLAIGTSRGWTAINEELTRVKDQYTEDLWILKY